MQNSDVSSEDLNRIRPSFDNSSQASNAPFLKPFSTTTPIKTPYEILFTLLTEKIFFKKEVKERKQICEEIEKSIEALKEKFSKQSSDDPQLKSDLQTMNQLNQNLSSCKKALEASEIKLKETTISLESKRKILMNEYNDSRNTLKKEIAKLEKFLVSNTQAQKEIDHQMRSYLSSLNQDKITNAETTKVKKYQNQVLDLQKNFSTIGGQLERMKKEKQEFEERIGDIGGVQRLRLCSQKEFEEIKARMIFIPGLKLAKKVFSNHRIVVSCLDTDEKRKFVAIAETKSYEVFIISIPGVSLQDPSNIEFYIDTNWIKGKWIAIRTSDNIAAQFCLYK